MKFRDLAIISPIFVASALTLSTPTSSQTLPRTASPLFAVLAGGNEVSASGDANAGDPDGIGSITVNIVPTIPPTTTSLARVCFGLNISKIDKPAALHIHKGQAGVNGPIVIGLAPIPVIPVADVPGFSSGCVNIAPSSANVALLIELQGIPKNFYVNVHTTKFPNGALRGQLF